jgi:hypothetical protein
MQVCDQAAQTLRKCGEEALTAALHSRLQSAQIVPEREAVIQLAFDLLGCRQPFVLTRLHDEEEENHVTVLRAFAPLAWRNHENLDLLAPFLASKNASEARKACHLMRLAETWLTPQAAGKYPPVCWMTRCNSRGKRSPEDKPLRMDCVGYAAFLTGGWDTLARTLSQRPAQDTARVVNLPRFTASHAAPLLRAYPALRDVFRTAIYGRFSAARPGSRYRELPLAKARPGQLNYATSGSGSGGHLATVIMNKMAGITMVHVPYKGSAPAMIDSISGQCHVHIASLITSLPHVREGRVRGIGVTSAKRSAAAPDIPAIAETLPGYEVVNSYYLLAPAGLPADVHTKLHADAVKAIRHPEVVERLARDGADPVGNTPAQATRYIEGEIQKWGKAVRESGAKADG